MKYNWSLLVKVTTVEALKINCVPWKFEKLVITRALVAYKKELSEATVLLLKTTEGGRLQKLLKLINNSSRQNKENHNREGGLDTRS